MSRYFRLTRKSDRALVTLFALVPVVLGIVLGVVTLGSRIEWVLPEEIAITMLLTLFVGWVAFSTGLAWLTPRPSR